MHGYMRVLNKAFHDGTYKGDRTGTGCYTIFGEQIRHKMADGFPLLTIKETKLRPIVKELLWFIQGGTNINDEVFAGCKIWDEWALKEDAVEIRHRTVDELIKLAAIETGMSQSEVINYYRSRCAETPGVFSAQAGRAYLAKAANVSDDQIVVSIAKRGDIGPLYGHQWRDFDGIDQLKEAIELLKVDPNSRRNLVSAWNPKYLPDPKFSPEENVANGRMALAPCHAFFQFCALPLSEKERFELLMERNPNLNFSLDDIFDRHGDVRDSGQHAYNTACEMLRVHDIPGHKLSLQLYQRSADVCIGVPFNIASYALLLALVANEVNMVPDEYIHTLGDTHIYSNQLTAAKEMLTRESRPHPRLVIKAPPRTSIFDIKVDDIEVIGYDPHPFIKIPVAK